MSEQDEPIFCARCFTQLTPGQGDFFIVRIEAVADPTPPEITAEDLNRDVRAELDDLVDQLSDYSERELLDQIHRRVVIHLCSRCFREWIECPAGRS